MPSEPILRKLESADRTWRRGLAFEWLLRLVKWACAVLLICVGIDLIAQLSSVPRLLISLGIALAGLAVLGIYAWRAWRQRGPLLRIARLLESRDPTLGSKLMNVLQLDEQAQDPARPEMTRQLASQAIANASGELTGHRFKPLLKSTTLKRSVLHAAVPLVPTCVLALSFAGIAWRQIERFVDPFGDHPPFSFTKFTILSPARDGEAIIYRKPVTIEVEFSGHRPDEVFLLVKNPALPDQELSLPMLPEGKDRFVQQIDEVTTNLSVRAATADRRSLSQARAISVILTPHLQQSTLRVEPPAYTKQKPRQSELPLGKGAMPAFSALAGSQLTFTLTSNRPLGRGGARLQGAVTSVETDLLPGTGDLASTASATLTPTESGRITFDLRDETGLSADREIATSLTVTQDLPPLIEITEPTQDGFIVDTFETRVAVKVSDDYGIQTTRLHSGINGSWNEPKVITAQVDPPQREGLEALPVRPVNLGAKVGDVISVFADVTDIRPDPQIARTRTLKLEVISEEQYNDLLRMESEIADLQEKFGSLHDELDRLVKEQRDLAEAAEAESKAGKNDPATQEKLAQQQSDLNQRLESLAEKMDQAVRDKPLYDLEKGLQKVLNKTADQIRESVAQNEKANAAKQESQQLADAGREQAERLDPTSKSSREEIDQAIAEAQQMQDLQKPLTAFEELYEQQKELAEQTEALKQKPELTREDKLALQDMATQERAIAAGLQEIAKELREKADVAEQAFPEAAQDARDIADKIEDAGLDTQAERASRSMLAARGQESHDRAENLRQDMEKMMPECKNCQPGMSGEFAQRLSLARSMLAGNTFEQMAMCRKFGTSKGMGKGQGMGQGGAGGMMASGNSTNQPQKSLLGGESKLGRRDKKESATASRGQSEGTPSPGASLAGDPNNRDSGTITTSNRTSTEAARDAAAEEYRDLVEAYFRKLTTSPNP